MSGIDNSKLGNAEDAPAWQRLAEAFTPFALHVVSEFDKWNVSSDLLRRAGWLPHYTTPFDLIRECNGSAEAVRDVVLDYYERDWQRVRERIEGHLSAYGVDEEAKATFHEALQAHETGLYRCVCRVLFPEVERVFRAQLFDNKVGPIGYGKFVRALVSDDRPLEEFVRNGLHGLSVFGHLTKGVREKDQLVSEADELIFGLFSDVLNEADRARLQRDPVPNRHAAIHGLVVYSSPQHSLNTIFMADYVFQIIPREARSVVSRTPDGPK
ncbi:hypothetical protein [Candidatus Palauibacter sp.]|uniref:hypothetical protein n=1 Tax=Candidatus Palauibacter sp. TaxID=3101350 RepID=UPI003B01F32A